jgi:hypothetical protein
MRLELRMGGRVVGGVREIVEGALDAYEARIVDLEAEIAWLNEENAKLWEVAHEAQDRLAGLAAVGS